ncbi:MAG TPA: hypothetical protein DCW42_05330 [Bacteroidetes bacterium]|nr:hypothetical protein [Bacteroidota bacterium]
MRKAILILFLLIFFKPSPISALEIIHLPKTQNSLKLLHKSSQFALNEVGVIEKTNRNDNIRINEYLASVGLSPRNPYCQAGQYWSFLQAINYFKLDSSEIPLLRTGSTVSAYNYAKSRKVKIIISNTAKKDDLLYWRNGKEWSGHVGRIIEVMDKGWVKTIEFNTTGEKGKEGVWIKKRNIFHVINRLTVRGILRIDY